MANEVYKLIKPIEYEGELIEEINMDLEGLTVGMLEKAERQARMMLGKGEMMGVPETNKKYLSCVAAKAAGVKLDLIRSLSGSDYTQTCLLVQNFLLGGDSDSMEDLEEEENKRNLETRVLTEPKTKVASTVSQPGCTN